MGDVVHLWRVAEGDQLAEVPRIRLDLESRLEAWFVHDISILDSGLLVIGNEVPTEFGGLIDILAVDRAGDLVIVELKRDKTPRQVTAQALDYASWVVGLSNERVREIAEKQLSGSLDEAFQTKFGTEIPETLNGDHRILVVAAQLDAASERIIKYLSDTHGVNINAVSFQWFNFEGHELLARVFLIEPSEVEQKTREKGSSKRRPNLTLEELATQAEEAGVPDLYREAVAAFGRIFPRSHTTQSSIAFEGSFGGSRKVVISLLPARSSRDDGLAYQLYKNRYAELARLPLPDVEKYLPDRREHWAYDATAGLEWEGFTGFIQTTHEIDRLADPLRSPPST